MEAFRNLTEENCIFRTVPTSHLPKLQPLPNCLPRKQAINLNIVGETVEFTEQETKLMLAGTLLAGMPAETISKMKALILMDYINELPRNLGALR